MPDPGSRSPLLQLSDDLSTIVARVAPHVVGVHSHRSRSSGFVWQPGLIVTADEALADDGEVSVTLPGGGTVAASRVGRDPSTGVALLRIETSDLAPVTLQSETPRTGAIALAIGSHEGEPVAALGIVSVAGQKWRSLRGGEIDARVELALSLRRSSEGGLALDASGGVLGMTVLGPRRRVLVIPSATIDRVAASLQAHGRIPRGYLGIGLQSVRMDDGDGAGAMAMSVDPQGPGAASGICQGDVIVAWDGEPVGTMRTLLRRLGPGSVGTSVRLTLRRGGEPAEVNLTVAERPEG